MTTYQGSGVDLEGAEQHVGRIAETVMSTWDSAVVGGFGGFAAGVELPGGIAEPIVMMTTDGVGTKLEIARLAGSWDYVGHDLVAMCVDDLAAVGARPIGFVDYMAVGALDADRDSRIVSSIARACLEARTPLLGGETAEHPGVMPRDAVDLAGAAMGVVDRRQRLDRANVIVGDVVVAMHSPNLRSNGFSLIRTVLSDRLVELAETLLEPSVIYAPAVLAAVDTGGVRVGAHITGGGLPGNVTRVVPDGLGVTLDLTGVEPPAVIELLRSSGIAEAELARTFNLGVGFALIVDPDMVDSVVAAVADHSPTVIGRIGTDAGVRMG